MALMANDLTGDGLELESLIKVVQEGVDAVKAKIAIIQNNKDTVSIGDMFEMQMIMNNLAQLSEMATNTVSSFHTATQSMARNVKS
jgi:hypothetical protein